MEDAEPLEFNGGRNSLIRNRRLLFFCSRKRSYKGLKYFVSHSSRGHFIDTYWPTLEGIPTWSRTRGKQSFHQRRNKYTINRFVECNKR